MTNPENAIGTNAAYGGRTSVNAFNDLASGFASNARGILSGWRVQVNDSNQILLGGAAGVRDVALAQDPNGNITTVNNISGQPITVTLPAAPQSGSRTDAIVAYVTNPPQGSSTTPDNPGACGLIVVAGYTPNSVQGDNQIREAITQDGAAGTNAYYVILAEALREAGETVLPTGRVLQSLPLGAPFTGNQIAKDTLDSSNFKWSKLASYTTHGSRDNVGSTEIVLASYTIPADGIYAISAEGSTAVTGGTRHIFNLTIKNNDTTMMAQGPASVANYAGNNSARATEPLTWHFTKGDVISLRGQVQNATTKVSYTIYIQQLW